MLPSEEGEEGELPFDQPVRDGKGGDQESGEASGFDEGEVPEEGADEDEKPPHLMPGATKAAAAGPACLYPGARRDMMSPKEGRRASPVDLGDGAGGKGGQATRGEEGQPRGGDIDNGIGSEHKEREELQSLLRELTRYVSVQDAMRSLDTVCQDLKKAIKKLDKLLRVCKRKKGEEVEAYPDCFAFSKKIMEGLKSVHLVVGTSIGHTKRMEGVLMLFKAAMNYRHDVLAGNQKQELEGWVRGSKVLKVIVEEKERAKAECARAAAAVEGTPGAGEGSTPTPGPERTPGVGVGDGEGGGGGGERVVAAGGAKSAEGPSESANGGGEGGVEVGGVLKGPEMGTPHDGVVSRRPAGKNGVAAQQHRGNGAQPPVAGGLGEDTRARDGEGPEPLVQRERGREGGAGETAAAEAGAAVQGWGGRVEHLGELLPPPLPVPEDVPPPPDYSDGEPAPPQLPNGTGPRDSPSQAPMPPPPPPPSSPPPPSEPYPEHHSPMSEDPIPQPQQTPTRPPHPEPQQLHRPPGPRLGTGGGRGGAKPAAAHAASSAFKFKIVVESSASDIRRPNMEKAAATAAAAASALPAEPIVAKDRQAQAVGDCGAKEATIDGGTKGGDFDDSGGGGAGAGGAEDKVARTVTGEGGRRERKRGREHGAIRTRTSEEGDEEGKGEGLQGPGTEGARSGKEREHRREREREKDSRRGRSRGAREKEGEGDGEGQQLQGSTVGGSHSKRSHRSSRSPDGGREGRSSKRMRADADGPSGRDKSSRHHRHERSERGWGPPLRGSSGDRWGGGAHGHSRGRSRDRLGGPGSTFGSSDHLHGISRGRSRDRAVDLSDLPFSRGRSRSRDRAMDLSDLPFSRGRSRSRDRAMDLSDLPFSRGRSRSRERAMDLLDLGFSRGRSRDRGVGGLPDVGFSRGRSRNGWDGPACEFRGGRDRSRSREGGRGRTRRKASRSASRDPGRARSWERVPVNAPPSPPPPTSSGLEDPAALLDPFGGPSAANVAAAAAAPGTSFFPPESPLSDEEADGGGLASLEPAPAPSAPTGWTFEQRQKDRIDRIAREKGEFAAALERGVASAAAAAAASADADGVAALAPEHEDARKSPGSGDEAASLLQQGRMVLALDLDHTLLSSARLTELEPETEAQLAQRQAAELTSLPDRQRELYRSERLGIWTKLRPGVRDFLAKAAEKFELWVYSAGSRPYAEAMAGLLDPDERLFQGRLVIAGGGADGPHGLTAAQNARLMSALQQRGSVSIALDEADALWPSETRLAQFVVERYLYFPSARRRFGMQGRSLLEINRDESPDHGMLMTALPLLERLHTLVLMYANHIGPAGQLLSAPPAEPRLPPWDIRNVLADERRKVLAGVSLSFSSLCLLSMCSMLDDPRHAQFGHFTVGNPRVIPIGTEPWLHPLWKMAEAYGARCSARCEDSITHVVASLRGTEKTCWAAQHGRAVVTPAWLECCSSLWRKANEERFATPL